MARFGLLSSQAITTTSQEAKSISPPFERSHERSSNNNSEDKRGTGSDRHYHDCREKDEGEEVRDEYISEGEDTDSDECRSSNSDNNCKKDYFVNAKEHDNEENDNENDKQVEDSDDTEESDDTDSSEDEEETPHPLGFKHVYGVNRFGISPKNGIRTKRCRPKEGQSLSSPFRDGKSDGNRDNMDGNRIKRRTIILLPTPPRSSSSRHHYRPANPVEASVLLRDRFHRLLLSSPSSLSPPPLDSDDDDHDKHNSIKLNKLLEGSMDRTITTLRGATSRTSKMSPSNSSSTTLVSRIEPQQAPHLPPPPKLSSLHPLERKNTSLSSSSSSSPSSTPFYSPVTKKASEALRLLIQRQDKERGEIEERLEAVREADIRETNKQIEKKRIIEQMEKEKEIERIKEMEEEIARKKIEKEEEMREIERKEYLKNEANRKEEVAKEEVAREEKQNNVQNGTKPTELAPKTTTSSETKTPTTEDDKTERSEKLIRKLDKLRSALAPFDSSKDPIIRKRRLRMKKIANGRLNTLSREGEGEKIGAVVEEVISELSVASRDDNDVRARLKAGDRSVTKEGTCGEMYLMDLIVCSVVKRIRAEGFNGTKGDGFPLANFLTILSSKLDHHPKEFAFIFTAHLYKACPTSIPCLPVITPENSSSESALMEALGMMKVEGSGSDKDAYETFPRFLARTEAAISLMAAIMSSTPSNHKLFGGGVGSVKWLCRFLDLLPSEQDAATLPLLTAPVLVSFLTASSHMLANRFSKEFESLLDRIYKTIVDRLDESPVGQPSATRLRKLLEGGIKKFRTTLPPGAIRSMYEVGDESSIARPTSHSVKTPSGNTTTPTFKLPNKSGAFGSSFGNTTTPSFGSTPVTNPGNTFGKSVGSFGHNPVPSNTFGISNQEPTTFISGTATPAASFGDTSVPTFGGSVPATSPFGSCTTTAPTFTSFGKESTAPVSTPFGNPASTFGSMNSTNGPTSTPFGTPAPAFSNSQPTNAQTTAPFGTSAPTFGDNHSTNTQSTATFGSPTPAFGISQSTNAPTMTPFGTTAPAFGDSQFTNAPTTGMSSSTSITPFAAAASSASPFGGPPNQSTVTPFNSVPNTVPAFGNEVSGTFKSFTSNTSAHSTSAFGGDFRKTQQKGNSSQSSDQICRFFTRGNCKFGSKCRFSHETGGGNEQMSEGGVGASWNNRW